MKPKVLFDRLMAVGLPEMESAAIANVLRDFQEPCPEYANDELLRIRAWRARYPLALLECSLSKAKGWLIDGVSDANLRKAEVVPVIIQAFAPLLVSPRANDIPKWTTRKAFENKGVLKHASLLMDSILPAMEASTAPKEVTSALARRVHDTMAHTLEVAIAAKKSDHASLLLMVPEFVERNNRIEAFHPRPYTPQPHHQQRFERFVSLAASLSPPRHNAAPLTIRSLR